MNIKMFSKEFMQNLIGDISKVLVDEIIEVSRWNITHHLVFKDCGVCYGCYYSVGATELQDESPFEYDGDMIECVVVVPVEKTVIVYEQEL